MAKKKTRRGDFNLSAAVRDLLEENPKLSGKEVYETLQEKNPGRKINKNSSSVAFSTARQKLGISKKKKRSVKRRKPSAARPNNSAGKLDMSILQSARKYVSEVGDVDKAVEAVRQLKNLQIG